jgi:hypothetical protein
MPRGRPNGCPTLPLTSMRRWRSGVTRRVAGQPHQRPNWRRPTPPELDIVGTYAGAPVADLIALFPYADGSALVGVVGYAINGVIDAYPEAEQAIRDKLTPRGADLIFKVQDQCIAETITKFMLRHLQPYFTEDVDQLVTEEPFKSVRPAGAVDGRQPARPRLVRPGCRRGISHQRAAAVPQQTGREPRAAHARRRRTGHAVDRRPIQRRAHHAELRDVLRRLTPPRPHIRRHRRSAAEHVDRHRRRPVPDCPPQSDN